MNTKIRLEKIRKEYVKPRTTEIVTALKDISTDIYEGEFLSIIGPSGCGKSTLLRIVAGLELDYEGAVYFDGNRVVGADPERGMLFQEYALFPWKDVLENVEFGLKAQGVSKEERREIAKKYIHLVELAGSEGKFPHELSGGMKQRTAIARLLATNPKVMLMDEPLAAVDAQTRVILQQEILRIWSEDVLADNTKRTVIWVTHSIEEAVFISDRVLVMTGLPGHIREIVEVPLVRPRTDETKKDRVFVDLCADLWQHIRKEAQSASVT